jgi:predicted GNAT family acetyltransferase
MKIEYVQKVHGTPVLPYIVDAYVSLRSAGNIEAMDAPVSGEEEAFYIVNRLGKIVAVLSFFQTDDNKCTINMGYVSKQYRKKGYYAALWERLVTEARKREIKAIIGYHKPGNKAILGFNERVGRRIKYICSEYTLETP